jgi:NSS family neurotransmitter:Na+ symporter
MGLFFWFFGLFAILSNIDGAKEYLTWGGKSFFDWVDYVTAAVMLPLGGLIMALFVGFVIPRSEIEKVLKPQLKWAFQPWYFSLRYITPVAMFVVMLSLMGVI